MILIAVILAATVSLYAIQRKRGIPDSVSEIAYIIPHWAFSAWIAVAGISLMPPMMDSLNENWQWIGFLSIVGLMCVSASAYYKTEAKTLHYVGGCLCALCATIVTAIIQPLLLFAWIGYLIMMIWSHRNWLFWGEVVVFALLVVALSI